MLTILSIQVCILSLIGILNFIVLSCILSEVRLNNRDNYIRIKPVKMILSDDDQVEVKPKRKYTRRVKPVEGGEK